MGPVAVAMDASSDLMMYYESGTISDAVACGTSLNHEVVAVGYNMEANPPYYIVRNSWGSEWGLEGYFNIAIVDGVGVCGIQMEGCYSKLNLLSAQATATTQDTSSLEPADDGTTMSTDAAHDEANDTTMPEGADGVDIHPTNTTETLLEDSATSENGDSASSMLLIGLGITFGLIGAMAATCFCNKKKQQSEQ